jgi:glycosyltransferase involved in cell wall biosynthesis
MTSKPRIAFYAPMKSPGHPVPSGDRQVGRLFLAALEKAGYRTNIASEFRAYENTGDATAQTSLQRAGAAEAARLVAQFRQQPSTRPDLWFTYHLYHKAPDWLGPPIAAALDIPYLIAEGSHAPKQSGGPWDINFRAAEAALLQADQVLCMTRLDLACVSQLRETKASTWFPPFLDVAALVDRDLTRTKLAVAHNLDATKPWLLTVAMMRERDKLPSYRVLADALKQVKGERWQLLIVGDGPARPAVEALFLPFGDNVRFAGEQGADALTHYYAAADIYAWPAVNEAYGMAFLEAQAAGAAVIAGDEPGVRDVVKNGETGVLVPVGHAPAFAEALDELLSNQAHRQQLAKNARSFVLGERNLTAAAGRLKTIIDGLVR